MAPTFNNAAPTRPDLAIGLPGASPQPTAVGELVEENRQEIALAEDNSEQGDSNNDWHELLRFRKRATSPPVHNTFTHGTKTTVTSSSAPVTGTEIAIFTAAGAVFTVTEISQTYAVDGKTLVPGAAPQLIAGEYISEGSKGAVVVNGQTLTFQPLSSSSSLAQPPPASSSSAAASSSSAAAGGKATSSSSSPGAAPVQTAAAHVVALVGAVVGVMVF